jgi:cytoplasmic iron level regulating protein YaaA (DUF328/UPF0246 family)
MPSSLFSKARTYIESKNYDAWFILSAKYGLLKPTDSISPYDQTLNKMRAIEIKEWSNKVFNKLIKYSPTRIDFYAGEKYRKYLIPLIESKEITYNIPLKGLGIGQQIQFYNREVNK